MISRIIRNISRFLIWGFFRPLSPIIPPAAMWRIIHCLSPIAPVVFRKRIKELECEAEFTGLSGKGTAKKAIIEHILNETDIFYFSKPSKLRRTADFENHEVLEKCPEGKILFISHFGPNAGIIPALSSISGYHQVGLSPTDLVKENDITDKAQLKILRIKDRLFERTGADFISHETGLRQALAYLRRGHTVGIAADGRAGRKFIKAKFLGKDAYFSEGPLKLAFISGASIIPVFPVRQGDRIKICFTPPLNCGTEGLTKEDFMGAVLQRYAGILESRVRNQPHCYLYYLYLCRKHTYGRPNSFFAYEN